MIEKIKAKIAHWMSDKVKAKEEEATDGAQHVYEVFTSAFTPQELDRIEEELRKKNK